jgi:hypothetical protein
MGCNTCGGGGSMPAEQIVVERMDGSTFTVDSATEARIQVALGNGKKYYASKKK